MTDNLQQQLFQRALALVNRVGVGLLLTADHDGYPDGRWMNVGTREGLRTLFTVTARCTRKIEQLDRNPKVCWHFSAENYGEVVKLFGSAEVHHDPSELIVTWDHLVAAARSFPVGPLSNEEDLELVVIETKVERGEILCPSLGVVTPHDLHLDGVRQA